jgi:hypothetical protein
MVVCAHVLLDLKGGKKISNLFLSMPSEFSLTRHPPTEKLAKFSKLTNIMMLEFTRIFKVHIKRIV